MKKLAWVALGLIGGGGVLGWQGWQDRGKWGRIEAAGKEAPGILEGGSVERGRRGRKSYSFTVTFTPEGGAARQQEFEVSREFAERVVKGDEIVEDKCTVRYDASDPSVAIIVGGSKDNRSGFLIGLGLIGGGLVLGFFLLRSKPQDAAPVANG